MVAASAIKIKSRKLVQKRTIDVFACTSFRQRRDDMDGDGCMCEVIGGSHVGSDRDVLG